MNRRMAEIKEPTIAPHFEFPKIEVRKEPVDIVNKIICAFFE